MNHCITLVNSLVDLTPVQPRLNDGNIKPPFSFSSQINKKNTESCRFSFTKTLSQILGVDY